MKIGPNFSSFNVSSKGMSIQRKKMDIVSENIANISTTKTENGKPYQKKFVQVIQKNSYTPLSIKHQYPILNLAQSEKGHLKLAAMEEVRPEGNISAAESNIIVDVKKDKTMGNMEYMPDHPDADENGYVLMPNVNVVTEMVDMIAATRSYEANLTAFNAAKEMTKDSLEI